MKTIVVQSYADGATPGWLRTCLDSVQSWALGRGYAYDVVGDAIFEGLPGWFRERTRDVPSAATALGRLIVARRHLQSGWDQVFWLDADTLVLDQRAFRLDFQGPYAFGREVSISRQADDSLRCTRRVTNAVIALRRGNPIVDFYIHACQQIAQRSDTSPRGELLGTNLLGALHNMLRFPVLDEVARFGRTVTADVLMGGGDALERLIAETPGQINAVRLHSALGDDVLSAACDALLSPARHSLLG